MMGPDDTALEWVSRVAPLGIRFVDTAMARPVQVPLEVVAYAAASPRKRLPLFANSSNIYVLQNVPGLRDVENAAGDKNFHTAALTLPSVPGSVAFWAALPAPTPYVIEVRDPSRSYHAFQFTTRVPTRGLSAWNDPAVPPSLPYPTGIPMFATISRAVPSGLASVQADLYDPQTQTPAAWAVLEVLFKGAVIGRGVADTDGRVSIALPYPDPIDLLPTNPLELGQPLFAQAWPLQMRVFYQPAAVPPVLPNLTTILTQPGAHLWAAWKTAPLAQTAYPGDTLRYGRPLVLRSSGLSVLYVTV